MIGEREGNQISLDIGSVEAIRDAARDLVPGGGDDRLIIDKRNGIALAILGEVRKGMGVQDAIDVVKEELARSRGD